MGMKLRREEDMGVLSVQMASDTAGMGELTQNRYIK